MAKRKEKFFDRIKGTLIGVFGMTKNREYDPENMIASYLPENEKERLEVLAKYQILGPELDKDFDGIVELATEVCDSPMAMINLIDETRQWTKASKGIEATDSPREFSICSYAILGDDILVVPDALEDERFFDNPYVRQDPKIRFYAGVPLVVDSGHKLGTLCVLDTQPRTLTKRQLADLKILAKQVINLLNLRLSNLELQRIVHNKTSELSDLFDRIGDAFISLDKNWNYTYANKQTGKLLHRDTTTLIGKNVWEEFPQAMGSATYQAFHRAMKEQRYIRQVDYFAPLNLWQENHIYPSPKGLNVLIRDISEQKRAEFRLVESIETLERAEEQAKMGSWQLDVASGTRHWSKQLFLIFGFVPGEIPPMNEFLKRVHPEDHSLLLASIEKMMNGVDPGESIIRTNPLVMPLRYLLGYTRHVKNEEGKIVRFEGIMIDVTELHKANNELDHFVYSISHDLRSPLSTILGLLNVAELEKPEPGMVPYLKQIREQVNRLDGFIKQILDHSTNARTETHQEKINFRALVDKVMSNINPVPVVNRVQVKVEISNEIEFYSDKPRLEIILNSLISNSLNYQDFNKDSCSIKLNVTTDAVQSKVVYSDNGIGIEKIHLAKVFNMFYRATEKAKGAGLGLYIVKETVHKLGGRIQVASDFGQGTTFEMYIPNLLLNKKEL